MSSKAKKAAIRLLEQSRASIPVNVVRIAESNLGITVKKVDLENSTSGFLIKKGGRPVIGVNQHHHPNRQRFTIAHEIGHFILHSKKHNSFIDTKYVSFRNKTSTMGIDSKEVEANAFAAELLMPELEIKRYLESNRIDALDELAVYRMAEQFGVSAQALTIRLTRLNCVPDFIR